LEMLHMDLFGPVAYLSIGGSKYGLVIVDDFSRFTWVFFLQDKTETQGTLKRFLRRAQNEFDLKVKKIRSDNGSEFKNLQVEEFLEEEGIKHEFSAPYTPQQNGVVERKNRTLIDMVRTMLGEFKTPEHFLSEAVNTACHAINRVYLHRLLKKTSYELLTGNKPNVSYFHVFGSKCYILVKKGRTSKFAPKAVEGFLLGYDSNTKAYSVFNKSSGLVEVSSDVVFDETNGSPREQVDLDVDEDDVPTDAIRTMAIGDVRLLGRRQRRHPSLEAFADVAGLTETKRAGTPFAPFGTRRRPEATPSRSAASFSSEAHV
jgi:hypothetical protein